MVGFGQVSGWILELFALRKEGIYEGVKETRSS